MECVLCDGSEKKMLHGEYLEPCACTKDNGWWHRLTTPEGKTVSITWISVTMYDFQAAASEYLRSQSINPDENDEEGFKNRWACSVCRGQRGHSGVEGTELFWWFDRWGNKHCMSWWTKQPKNNILEATGWRSNMTYPFHMKKQSSDVLDILEEMGMMPDHGLERYSWMSRFLKHGKEAGLITGVEQEVLRDEIAQNL